MLTMLQARQLLSVRGVHPILSSPNVVSILSPFFLLILCYETVGLLDLDFKKLS